MMRTPRSTDPQHERKMFRKFFKNFMTREKFINQFIKDIITPCESFWTEAQLEEGKCPDCGREVHYHEEESYFLSYQNIGIVFYNIMKIILTLFSRSLIKK